MIGFTGLNSVCFPGLRNKAQKSYQFKKFY